jgi:hypothetical protein
MIWWSSESEVYHQRSNQTTKANAPEAAQSLKFQITILIIQLFVMRPGFENTIIMTSGQTLHIQTQCAAGIHHKIMKNHVILVPILSLKWVISEPLKGGSSWPGILQSWLYMSLAFKWCALSVMDSCKLLHTTTCLQCHWKNGKSILTI